MFAKYKNKDNVFKDLIMYQKPLKTLYQQLVLKGYTDTEEEFLDKVLKIAQGREYQEIDDLITSLTKDLENTNSILSSVKTMSAKNKSDINKNKRSINDLADEVSSRCDYLYGRINSTDDEVEDINNNRLPKDGSENQVLLKGDDKNTWKSLDEIPLTIADVSTDNEILGLFQIKMQSFTLGKILNENSQIKVYIDGVLQDLDKISQENNGELRFFKDTVSSRIVDVEVFGDRENDVIEYNQSFLEEVTYASKVFFNYDPFKGVIASNAPAFFSHNVFNLTWVEGLTIGEKALTDSSKYLFDYCRRLTHAEKIDLGNCTSLDYFFGSCDYLVSFSFIDTSKVTDTSGMFDRCISLTSIPKLDTSNVKFMYSMFNSCTSLTTIPLLDTGNATYISHMFAGCSNLQTIPELNTSKVVEMNYMFEGCTSLTTIPLLDTSKVTYMQYMFKGCTSLTTIPQLDMSNATSTDRMFVNCISLQQLPKLNSINVVDMQYMFAGCTSLTRIEGLNVSTTRIVENMFSDCNSLSYINLISNNVNNLQGVINQLPAHEGAATDVYTVDLTECTIDVSSITAPAGWTIKLPTSGGGE